MVASGGLLLKNLCTASISFMRRNTATATVSASDIGMKWGQGNMKQGMPLEDYVGKRYPKQQTDYLLDLGRSIIMMLQQKRLTV
jgi:hypothetical protein